MHANPSLALRVHINQELGVNPDDQPSPVVAAGSSLLCFAIGALVPLIPYLLGFASLITGLLTGAGGCSWLGWSRPGSPPVRGSAAGCARWDSG